MYAVFLEKLPNIFYLLIAIFSVEYKIGNVYVLCIVEKAANVFIFVLSLRM